MTNATQLTRRHQSCDNEFGSAQCSHSKYISENAAELAVKKVFAILGADIDRIESVEEFRDDLRFGRKMRKVADHGLLAFFGVVAAAFAAAVWVGIVSSIKH